MRYLKKLLIAVYVYMGVIGILSLIAWMVTGQEPSALIMGVFGAAGVESIIAGIMRINEMNAEERARREEKKHERKTDSETFVP